MNYLLDPLMEFMLWLKGQNWRRKLIFFLCGLLVMISLICLAVIGIPGVQFVAMTLVVGVAIFLIASFVLLSEP